jgi:hypothetical protein
MGSGALCCKLDPGVNPIYAERYGGDLSAEKSNAHWHSGWQHIYTTRTGT